MRWLPFVALITACATDPCGAFGGQTCVALTLQGSLTLDQLLITASFGLTDAPSPQAPLVAAVSTPVALAVLAGDATGQFSLSVRAFLAGNEIGNAAGGGTLAANAATPLTLTFTAESSGDLAPQPDLRHSIDLAGADLAGVQCDVTTQVPCPSGQKCIFNPTTQQCQPDGTQQVAQSCTVDPIDDCARGTQCLFQGNLTDGVCEQFCASEADCKQAPVSVGGTPLANNRAHCLFQFGGSGPVNLCSLACNPVSSQGASGCPNGSACIYASNASFPELTFCDRAGAGGDGQACDSNFRCGAGFNCVGVNQSFICRATCRAGTDSDCAAPQVCKPGAGGAPPMFGYCCPSTGC